MAKKRIPISHDGYKPGVYVGRHPDTGVIYRLTIQETGKVKIERKPYVSNNADGWTQTYQDLTCEVSKQIFLILKITTNPCDWD